MCSAPHVVRFLREVGNDRTKSKSLLPVIEYTTEKPVGQATSTPAVSGDRCSAKTTKPPYSSLSILVVVLVHLIVRSETALVA
jgi:hypothetical protein